MCAISIRINSWTRKAHEAEVKELVTQSENQLMHLRKQAEAAMTAKRRSKVHREAQEGRLEHAESTARRLEQEAKREETNLAVHDTSQLATDVRDDVLSTLATMYSQLKERLEQAHSYPGTMDACRSPDAPHAKKVSHKNPLQESRHHGGHGHEDWTALRGGEDRHDQGLVREELTKKRQLQSKMNGSVSPARY